MLYTPLNKCILEEANFSNPVLKYL